MTDTLTKQTAMATLRSWGNITSLMLQSEMQKFADAEYADKRTFDFAEIKKRIEQFEEMQKLAVAHDLDISGRPRS